MFSIEHQFDASVITLVDEGDAPLNEDIVIHAFDDGVTVDQHDPITGQMQTIRLSITQLRDLTAALNLPEGIYRRAGAAKE